MYLLYVITSYLVTMYVFNSKQYFVFCVHNVILYQWFHSSLVGPLRILHVDPGDT